MSPKQIVTNIDDYVDSFQQKMTPIQKSLYNRIELVLKDISVDSEGNIKRTIGNLNKINKVKSELSSVIRNPDYQDLVSGIQESLSEINSLQNNYYSKIDTAFEVPKVMSAIQDQAFESSVIDLTEAGIKDNLVNEAVSILQQHITEGGSFGAMQTKMKDFILGNKETDGKLVSYSRQIMSDTMHMTARKYNSIVSEDLGLEWYLYVGSEKPTSRQFCIEMIKKQWIHSSELAKCASRYIPGHGKVSLEGLMPGTTGKNLIDRCGGYNCAHALIAVPMESVPKSVRNKIAV